MKKPWTVAIDGPAGAGKSTVARLIAQRLGYLYVDTGAMYRTVALAALDADLKDTDEDAISAIARSVRIEFVPGDGGEPQRVFLNDEDVTDDIRDPEVGQMASVVSAIPGVRAALVAMQQAFGAAGGVVMEGRDIGTVVFPNAEIKVFLTATAEERASRRHADLLARGDQKSLEQVRAQQDERDNRDATRSVSPLVAARDAFVLNSDGMSPEEVTNEVMELIEARRRES